MATLTWQDVAGQVRAPDFSDAAAAITRGIEGIGSAVQGIASAPAEREQARIASQMALAATGQKFLDFNEVKAEKDEERAYVVRERAAAKEFGAAQSTLEALTRDTIAAGGSFDDVLKSDAYMKLGEGARSYGAAHLSDAAYQGSALLEQRRQDARQQQQWAAGHALSQANAARMASADARDAQIDALRIKELTGAAARQSAEDLAKKGGLKTKDRGTQLVLGRYQQEVMRRMADASGGEFFGVPTSKVAKEAGFEDFSDASDRFLKFNSDREKQGQQKLPDDVLKVLLSQQAGKNNWLGMYDTFDESSFDTALGIRAQTYDNAVLQTKDLMQAITQANRGQTFDDRWLLEVLQDRTPERAVAPGNGLPDLSSLRGVGRR